MLHDIWLTFMFMLLLKAGLIVNYIDTFSRSMKADDDRLQALIQEFDPHLLKEKGSLEDYYYLALCVCPAILRLAEIALPHVRACVSARSPSLQTV